MHNYMCVKQFGCSPYVHVPLLWQMHCALSIWKLVPPLEGLQLLDYAYQDPQVREFAVKSVAQFRCVGATFVWWCHK